MTMNDRVIPLLVAMENEDIPVLTGVCMASGMDEIAGLLALLAEFEYQGHY